MKTISEARPQFPEVKRGYDPGAVDEHFEAVQTRLHELENQLVEAREAEQAIQLTFQAATKAKQELLEAAGEEAKEIIAEARREAMRLRDEAKNLQVQSEEQAERLVSEAQRDALRLLSDSRRDAEELNKQLQLEHAETMEALGEAHAALESAELQFNAATSAAASRLASLKTNIDGDRGNLADAAPPALDAIPEPELEEEAPEVVAAEEPVVAIDDTAPAEPAGDDEPDASPNRQQDLLAALQSLSSL